MFARMAAGPGSEKELKAAGPLEFLVHRCFCCILLANTTQGAGNRSELLIEVSARSHCNGHGYRKVGKVGATINLLPSLLPEKPLL